MDFKHAVSMDVGHGRHRQSFEPITVLHLSSGGLKQEVQHMNTV